MHVRFFDIRRWSLMSSSRLPRAFFVVPKRAMGRYFCGHPQFERYSFRPAVLKSAEGKDFLLEEAVREARRSLARGVWARRSV